MAEHLDIEKIKKTKNIKFELDLASPNKDYAIFLPSISSLYTRHVSKKNETIRNGNLPKGMTGIEDLDFLDPEKGLYWYPWALYSAGHAQLDLIKTDIQESMVQKRDKESTFILADSGGYQLSTGVLKGDIGDLNSLKEDPKSLRHRILKWMEHTADFSMILDIPTTSVKNEKSFVYKRNQVIDKIIENEDGSTTTIYKQLKKDDELFQECLNYTIKNCEYFIVHRSPGKTKLLNVLQGRNIKNDGTGESDIWWEAVKKFNDTSIYGDRAFEGWAIPGNLKFDFQMLMKRLKIMNEEGFLKDTGDTLLIHFLGISRIGAGLLYTTLQRELRKNINPNILITYDAASSFMCVAKGKGYTRYTISNKKLSYKMDPVPDGDKHHHLYTGDKDIKLDRNDPWVQKYTVLGKRLTIKDICIKENEEVKSSWDGTSYVFIMNMNTEQHIKAILEAHEYYDGENPEKRIPKKILRGKMAIEQIIRNKFSDKSLTTYLPQLENVLGLKPQEVGPDGSLLEPINNEIINIKEEHLSPTWSPTEAKIIPINNSELFEKE